MDFNRLKSSAVFVAKVLGTVILFMVGSLALGTLLATAVTYSPIGTVIGTLVLCFVAMTIIRYRQTK